MAAYNFKSGLPAPLQFTQGSGTGGEVFPGVHKEIAANNSPFFKGARWGGTNLVTAPNDLTNPAWAEFNGGSIVSANEITLNTSPLARVEQQITILGGTANRRFLAVFTVRTASGTHPIVVKNTHAGVADNYSVDILATTTPTPVALVVDNSAATGNGKQVIGIKNSATSPQAGTLIIENFALVDVTGMLNPYIPYDDIGLWHDTTNASYAVDGVLYPLVGANIDQRPHFDGSTQSVDLTTEITMAAGNWIEFVILPDAIATGTDWLLGSTSSSSGGVYYHADNENMNAYGSGETYYVDGVATNDLVKDGSPHHVRIEDIEIGRSFDRIARDHNDASQPNAAIWNIVIHDGTNTHFWRGGPADADWQDQIGSNHGTIVNGPLAVLPSELWGYQSVPEYTNQQINLGDWDATGTTVEVSNAVEAPDGTLTAWQFSNLTDAEGDRVGSTVITASGSTTWANSLWAKGIAGEVARFYAKRASGGAYAGTAFKDVTLSGGWEQIQLNPFTLAADNVGFRVWVSHVDGVTTADVIQLWAAQSTEGEVHYPIAPADGNPRTTEDTQLTQALELPVPNNFEGEIVFRPMFAHDDDKGAFQRLVSISDGTENNRFDVYLNQTTKTINGRKVVDGVSTFLNYGASPEYARFERTVAQYKFTPAGIALNINDLGWQWVESAGAGDDFGSPLNRITFGGAYGVGSFNFAGWFESASFDDSYGETSLIWSSHSPGIESEIISRIKDAISIGV